MRHSVTLRANYTWPHCIGLPLLTLFNPGHNYIHSGLWSEPGTRQPQLGCGRLPTGPAAHREHHGSGADAEVFQQIRASRRHGLDLRFLAGVSRCGPRLTSLRIACCPGDPKARGSRNTDRLRAPVGVIEGSAFFLLPFISIFPKNIRLSWYSCFSMIHLLCYIVAANRSDWFL